MAGVLRLLIPMSYFHNDLRFLNGFFIVLHLYYLYYSNGQIVHSYQKYSFILPQ